ncbi:MAG: phosphate signaling complex protein PhoU [Eubacteriales bacterium]|nr:phosphate signaling complex protein PhoU [Eubacteriales bacterium]
MRSRFDEQLEQLNREMITMGMLCENAIEKAAQALLENDSELAGRLPELQTQVNHKEREIENICLRLLLHQQPVAKDLRTVSAALKMVTDIERIGDQSTDIAEIISMSHIHGVDESLPIREMAAAVIKMVTDSMDAFVKRDIKIAKTVVKYDDVLDGYFNDVKGALIDRLKEAESDGEEILDLLMVAKYFERIGDHAVNIANWVLFSITGILMKG